jgi:hypothetical protein
MKRWLGLLLASGLVWTAATDTAFAQNWQIGGYSPPNVRSRPTYSPYLNLGAGAGGNAASTYYGIVRPQFDLNRNTVQLGQLQQTVNQPPPPIAPGPGGEDTQPTYDTGHPATFFNTSHYFGTGAPRGAAGGGLGAGNNANRPANNVFNRR